MKVRELLTVFGVKADTKQLEKFGKGVNETKDRLTNLARTAVRSFAAIATAQQIVSFARFINETAQAAENTALLADSLGVARSTFQEVDAVVKVLGADTNDTADLFTTLNDRARDAAGGAKSMAEDFKLIGINAKQLKGLGVEEVFNLVAKKAKETSDDSKVAAFAVRALGDDLGRKLLPALREGSMSFDNLRKEARASGKILSDQQINTFQRYRKTLRTVQMILDGIKNSLASAVIPFFERATKSIGGFVSQNKEFLGLKLQQALDFVSRRLEVLRRVFNTVADAFARLGQNGASLRVIMAIVAVLALLGTGVGQILIVIAFFEDLFVALKGGESVIGKFASKFPIVSEGLDMLREALKIFERELAEALGTLGVAIGTTGKSKEAFVEFAAVILGTVLKRLSLLIVFLGKVIKVMANLIAFAIRLPETYEEAVDAVADVFLEMYRTIKSIFDDIEQMILGLPRKAANAARRTVANLPGISQARDLAASAADVVGGSRLFGGGSTTTNTQNSTVVQVDTLRVESNDPGQAGRNVANTLEDQLRFARESFGGSR